MNIVIITWSGRNYSTIIDGHLPIYTTRSTSGYMVPDNQVDEFISMALSEPSVKTVNRYAHHSTHKN